MNAMTIDSARVHIVARFLCCSSANNRIEVLVIASDSDAIQTKVVALTRLAKLPWPPAADRPAPLA